MPLFEIQGPDGKTYEIDAPDENSALGALGQLTQQPAPRPSGQPQHFDFDPANVEGGVPGYNSQTGMVEGDDALSKIRTGSGGVLEGIPVVGPLIRGGVDRAAAATLAPFSDKDYDEVLRTIQAGTEAEKSMNPKVDTAAQVTGAVAGTIPMMAAAPSAFGIGQATRFGRIGGAMLGGGGLGSADAFVRSGGDLRDAIEGGFWGAGTAGLGTYVAPWVGKGVKKVADALLTGRLAKAKGVDKGAFNLLAQGIERDGLDAASANARLAELGPDAMVLDLGPNLKHQAAALAAMPGEGQKVVRGAIEARDAAANRRIIDEVNSQLGPAPVPRRVTANIEVNQRNLSPQYRDVFQNASPVDTRPIARYLDQEIQTLRGEAQRGLQRVRTMLNRVGTEELETNPVTLLETRKAIDGMLETVQETNARNALTTARQAVDDELRASVPGIKEVDAKYAELARQDTALQRGQTVLANGREAPRPIELADEFRQGALPQGEQIGPSAVPVRLRQGARAEIERIIGTNANDRVALQRLIKGEGDWNRDRLATLFGQDRADRIIRLLDNERAFADTSSIVTRNSESLARREAINDLTGQSGGDFGVVDSFKAGGVSGATRAAGIKGVEKVVEALQGVKTEAARKQMAETLTSNNTEVVDALLKAAKGSSLNPSQIDRVSRALLLTTVGGVGR
ncbi:hypothetical protein IG197_01815 [Aminobacter sp. SR38]|jgi:hypothetical protein|uniref:hypothetical protein n=1 Tax=Aminobacter sp. SR38 TaxID=2774562 RepID=UPI00177B861C|nr:hypothetical protein [Aminobacter sp. SR38]QOF71854.1 hypothetical protein IG197_01815 [Aminobacter sp. SR38]